MVQLYHLYLTMCENYNELFDVLPFNRHSIRCQYFNHKFNVFLYFRITTFDTQTNTINLPWGDNDFQAVKFNTENCICIINPLTRESYIYAFDPMNPSGPPIKLLIKPKTDEDFDL